MTLDKLRKALADYFATEDEVYPVHVLTEVQELLEEWKVPDERAGVFRESLRRAAVCWGPLSEPHLAARLVLDYGDAAHFDIQPLVDEMVADGTLVKAGDLYSVPGQPLLGTVVVRVGTVEVCHRTELLADEYDNEANLARLAEQSVGMAVRSHYGRADP